MTWTLRRFYNIRHHISERGVVVLVVWSGPHKWHWARFRRSQWLDWMDDGRNPLTIRDRAENHGDAGSWRSARVKAERASS